MRRRRPGRPRKQMERRTARGTLVRQTSVPPTPELLRHRQALVGAGGDLRLAENPLGVLLALELITEEELAAGQRFAWLHRLVFGRQSCAASDPRLPRGVAGTTPAIPPLGAGQAAWLAAREKDFDRARGHLEACGGGVYAVLRRVAVEQEFAGWMGAKRRLTASEELALQRLQAGLDCLVGCFGLPRTERRRTGQGAGERGLGSG